MERRRRNYRLIIAAVTFADAHSFLPLAKVVRWWMALNTKTTEDVFGSIFR